jgi:hypothetical protein
VVIWAVGILDKVVLRWRRKRVGLRSSHQENDSKEESDDEDFLKVFRQEKVHAAIEKALARVRSMVRSAHARQQYNRLLEMYRQAKVYRPKIKIWDLNPFSLYLRPFGYIS